LKLHKTKKDVRRAGESENRSRELLNELDDYAKDTIAKAMWVREFAAVQISTKTSWSSCKR
jgi:hypothetical protein